MTRRALLCCLAAFFPASPACAADADSSITYEVAQVDGVRVGSRVCKVSKQGEMGKQYLTTATLDLTLRRYGALVRLRREEGCVESADGVVLGVSLRQGAAGGKQLAITGKLEEGKMLVQVDDRPRRQLVWNKDVVGLRGQDLMWADKKPKTGDGFRFQRYEPTYNTLLNVKVEVKDRESVDVLGTRQSLLRVEMTPEPLIAPGIRITVPQTVYWLDDAFSVVRRQLEMDGLGTVVLTRTSKDKLGSPGGNTLDIGSRSLVALDRAISHPYDSRKVTYRFTFKGVADPASLMTSDEHQKINNEKGDSFELTVQPARPGRKGESTEVVADEFLASSHFIDSDDEHVVELARQAIAGERDPWKKALRIERWVKRSMRNDNAASLAPASKIARSLRGDCRHHAFLTAAMCRAVNLPSRTAIGLLYVNRGGPRLGFHTWVEVLINGHWVGVDSTLGKGGVSAAHVKVTQHSWHATESMTPLLPVNRVLGKVRVDVLRAE